MDYCRVGLGQSGPELFLLSLADELPAALLLRWQALVDPDLTDLGPDVPGQAADALLELFRIVHPYDARAAVLAVNVPPDVGDGGTLLVADGAQEGVEVGVVVSDVGLDGVLGPELQAALDTLELDNVVVGDVVVLPQLVLVLKHLAANVAENVGLAHVGVQLAGGVELCRAEIALFRKVQVLLVTVVHHGVGRDCRELALFTL